MRSSNWNKNLGFLFYIKIFQRCNIRVGVEPGASDVTDGSVNHDTELTEHKPVATVLCQWTRSHDPILVLCWASVYDAGRALNQHLLHVSCLLAWQYLMYIYEARSVDSSRHLYSYGPIPHYTRAPPVNTRGACSTPSAALNTPQVYKKCDT